MAIFYTPIYTQTASGSASTISFTALPQNFTDLVGVVSGRLLTGGRGDLSVRFNGDTASSNLYSTTRLYGAGSGGGISDRPYGSSASFGILSAVQSTETTSNVFTSVAFWIPNYTANTFKQIVSDGVVENNATEAFQLLSAVLYRSTSAIQSVSIFSGANFSSLSTFSLYGVTRYGV